VVGLFSRHVTYGCQFVRSGARPTMQGPQRVSFLVYTLSRLRARLLGTACLENGFVGNIARVHGCNVPSQRCSLRSHSLLLHGAVFHPWSYCLARIRSWLSATWTIRVEMDWHRNNYWRDRADLHSRTDSRPLSANRNARAQGRFQGVVSVATGNKSRHAVKHDGSLLRLGRHPY